MRMPRKTIVPQETHGVKMMDGCQKGEAVKGLIDRLWASRGMTPAEKHILVYLAYHSGERGACRVSLSALSRDTGLSKWGAQRILKRLRERGYLTWGREPGEQTNTYRLNPDRLGGGDTRWGGGAGGAPCTG